MKSGLISENIYERTVCKQLQFYNDKGAALGNVCAFFEDKSIVVSAGYTASLSKMKTVAAVISSLNELYAKGIIPIGVNLTLMMPSKYSEEKMRKILVDIEELLEAANVKVIHFHGENTAFVNEPVLISTAVGRFENEDTKSAVDIGDDIVLIGTAGEAGAAILAVNELEKLKERLPEDYILQAVKSPHTFLVRDEAALAMKSGATSIFHVSESGIYAALWNMAKECRVGLDINIKDIPIRQETVEICNYLDINPYELFSEGCLLVTIKDGHELVEAMFELGAKAAVIGKITDSNDKVVITEDERKFLTKPCPDELLKYMGKDR